jgi:hypothetical protein
MSLRASLTRLAIATAAGALATAAAVVPAGALGTAPANDEWGGDGASVVSGEHQPQGGGFGGGGSGGDGFGGGSGGAGGNGLGGDGRDPHGGGHHDSRYYKGVVTAQRLLLRSAPNRGSQVIRAVHRGDVVSIYCKAPGETVDGNPLWYLLTDGTWAWGAARYIDNIGPAPRWC